MIQYQTERVTVFESQLFKTTSTVVETADCILVVDPTWLPAEIKEIQNFVEQRRHNRPLYLLFTHSDYDHILGYGAFPDAKVIASRAFTEHPDPESVLSQIRTFDDFYYVDRSYDLVYPNVDIIAEDTQSLQIGETKLSFYTAPGHTKDGIFTIVEPVGIFIAGDYLSDIEFPYIYDSSTTYLQTLHKAKEILKKHKISLLVAGHGHVTTEQVAMTARISEAERYILNLRQAIIEQQSTEANSFIGHYRYLQSMKDYHEANVTCLKNELGITSK
ncbi:MBL fold metallo-hydrolase [Solibacillus sp. CAU 1738]|uniref:MBL fold metallo-hydrolase n=1 Tax=Solibacillus sp. CAU 1738 TaxID=3140363 RepID=UPI00326008D2